MISNDFLCFLIGPQMLPILLSCLFWKLILIVTEELVFNSLHGTTTCKGIFKDVVETIIQYNIKWNLLKCVIYHGGKSVWSRLKYNLYKTISSQSLWNCNVFNAYSYLLYYSSVVLCGNYLNLPGVTESGVSTMNFTHPCGGHCYQFCDFL